jgi:pyruvate/2-oxoglutarate dehydrogenase complex dihydrolipoamide dehydrogenase (E3) component
LETDVVLVSVGRRPYTDKLGLKEVGVKVDAKGRVEIDHEFRTNVPSIRAIGGTVTSPSTHAAFERGRCETAFACVAGQMWWRGRCWRTRRRRRALRRRS